MKKSSNAAKRVYWDTCVFLELIEGDESRRHGIEAVLNEAEKGNVHIYTSTLTIAEVTHAKSERQSHTLDKDVEDRINAMWDDSSVFILVDVFVGIGLDAQRIVRDAIKNVAKISPPDAIHLATAVRLGCKEFHTFDEFKGQRDKIAKLLKLKITEPTLPGTLQFGRKQKKS